HRRLELARMRRYLRAADAVVMSTREAAARAARRFPDLHEKPLAVIPNGYERADFERPVPAREDRIFRIVHTGYLHTQLGRRQRRAAPARRLLGGAVRGV